VVPLPVNIDERCRPAYNQALLYHAVIHEVKLHTVSTSCCYSCYSLYSIRRPIIFGNCAEVGALFATVSSIRVSRVSVMVSVRDSVK